MKCLRFLICQTIIQVQIRYIRYNSTLFYAAHRCDTCNIAKRTSNILVQFFLVFWFKFFWFIGVRHLLNFCWMSKLRFCFPYTGLFAQICAKEIFKKYEEITKAYLFILNYNRYLTCPLPTGTPAWWSLFISRKTSFNMSGWWSLRNRWFIRLIF